MLKFAARLAAGLVVLVAVVLGVAYLFRAELMMLYLNPGKPFEAFTPPPAPDYETAEAWAAFPGRADNADLAANGFSPPLDDNAARADVFFIHPTTYYSRDGWNGAIEDESAREMVLNLVLPNQASAFNGAGRIFAPFYRQATLYSFIEAQEDPDVPQAPKAFGLAYSDVARAFETYIRVYNNGRPFILAAHSQGSLHLVRLLQDYFRSPEMRSRLIAAYAVGYTVPRPELSPAVTNLPLCNAPEETGCLVTWSTFTPEGDATDLFSRPVWADGELIPVAAPPLACTNPLSWHTDGVQAAPLLHRNAIPLQKVEQGQRALPAATELSLGARCDSDGILRLSDVPPPAFSEAEVTPGNLHLYDYNLFYGNIRENADRRVAAWFATR